MGLDARKQRILQAITDDYIETAEPVGSRTLARKYRLGVSPATIRNEMADLEESGYLEQPHVSSGRVPSDRGYRYYVDVLIRPEGITAESRLMIEEGLLAAGREVEQLIRQSVQLLSSITCYTSLAVTPRIARVTFRELRLIVLDELHLLAVVLAEPGVVMHRVIELHDPLVEQEVHSVARAVSEALHGRRLAEIGPTVMRELKEAIPDLRLFEQAMEILGQALAEQREQLVTEGIRHLLNQPEFRDIEHARRVLGKLEDREAVLALLGGGGSGTLRVAIGHENEVSEIQSCSVVTATYSIGQETVGSLGVIGPTRMQYARVMSVISYVADRLSEVLSEVVRK